MKLFVNNRESVYLDENTFLKILDMYPEENLKSRDFFSKSLIDKKIDLEKLKKEADIIQIPWQMFFLNPLNLEKELNQIENLRFEKIKKKFFISKRNGLGNITSKRIIDRIIRIQESVVELTAPEINQFNNLLVGNNYKQKSQKLIKFFDIDIDTFLEKNTKRESLEYLIEKIESKNIYVSQGVRTNKIFPESPSLRKIYKNTSGFVLKDDFIPFIFLPGELNDSESNGRQIYTLLYLLVVIGNGDYNYAVSKNLNRKFKASYLIANGSRKEIFKTVSYILLPESVTNELNININRNLVSKLSSLYKLTPTAVIITLLDRNIIDKDHYLVTEIQNPSDSLLKKTFFDRVSVSESVKKSFGLKSFSILNKSFKDKKIRSKQLQYLIFGYINKAKFKEYINEI